MNTQNEEPKIITINDIKFGVSESGKASSFYLDDGLRVVIHKYDKERCLQLGGNFYSKAAEHMYGLTVYDYESRYPNAATHFIDFNVGTKWYKGMWNAVLFLDDDNELNKALKTVCLLDVDMELPEEKTETLKSAEKEDRAKQSLDRIRTKKKSVSGVYVADKIGEAMRSGVISETVTPEKGKQLSDNIKKKYIMDQQQKS